MSRTARRGVCLVLSAPSGAGKTAIADALLASEPALRRSVSATTRAPRPGEMDGVDYHFRSRVEFDRLVQSGELVEWATVLGRHCYGTPRGPVQDALTAGADMIFDIDWQGHQHLRAALPGDVISVFILPPDMATLDARLRKRAGDDPMEIARRMSLARDEISHWREFDHVVVNEEFRQAVESVRAVLHAARSAISRQPGLRQFVQTLAGDPA